jgi:hypothetical protein
VPSTIAESNGTGLRDLGELGITVETVEEVEEEAAWYYYAQKVFAAAKTEANLAGKTETLAWLDEDTVFLQEPDEFNLPEGVSLGYRPAMHRNIAPLWSDPLDSFWQRIYDLLSVPAEAAWPMVTPADDETIHPWVNAGCLVVRPERGLMRKWAEYWTVLYRDPELKRMCETDSKRRIFLHQAALTCAVLNHPQPEERAELSPRINYPLFFREMFGGKHEFDDLSNVATFRHESYFRNPAPDWDERLKGPPDRIAWIRTHLA